MVKKHFRCIVKSIKKNVPPWTLFSIITEQNRIFNRIEIALFTFWRIIYSIKLQKAAVLWSLTYGFHNLPTIARGQSFKNVYLGFPDSWDGDKYSELYCPSKNIPKFLDGYFLCQLSASYGSHNAPPGQRLNHMIDAIGAVGSFHITNGEVTFTAKYYPARPYKIWEFYDRNMTKASVPWAGWSDYNLTALTKWEQVPANTDSARFHPNLDFWRVGKKIIAGTEAPYWVGYEFDIFPFTEDSGIFGNPEPSMIPISMAIHERRDNNDIIWGTFNAMNFDNQRFFQGIFTINAEGVRKVVAMYDFGTWDANACAKDDEYIGDKTLLPGYIHSITSTENYIILPITSLLINPCKFKEPPRSGPTGSHIQTGGLWGMDFYDMVPMRFLVFDKHTLKWITQKPLEVFPSMFITHQLNAFENSDGELIADMIVYDSHDPYVKYFYSDFLTSQVYPSTARILRFTLDIIAFRVMYSYLIPQETIAADFPQINHEYDSKPYQWAYLVEHPFAAGNQILKINVEDPAGARNSRFKAADPKMVLHEPWYVPKPDAIGEDDGVLLVKALDLDENKGVILVLDAGSMVEIGRAIVPISVPFGFHNRFFTKKELGISGFDGMETGQSSTSSVHSRWERRWEGPWKRKPLEPASGSASGQRFWSRFSSTTQIPETPNSWIPIQPIQTPTPSSSPNVKELGARSEIYNRPTPMPWWPSLAPSESRGSIYQPEPPFPLPMPSPSFPSPSFHKIGLIQVPVTLYPPSSAPLNSLQPTRQPALENPYEPSGVASSAVEMPPASFAGRTGEKQTSVVEMGESLTLRQLYERALRALCRWLPRIFKHITYQGCMTGGQRAIRWMAPLTQRITSFPSDDEEALANEVQEADGRLRPVLRPLDPHLNPWYNYRTTVFLSGKKKP